MRGTIMLFAQQLGLRCAATVRSTVLQLQGFTAWVSVATWKIWT
jgi:hypothetical protein